ncbi:MAG: phosphatase [Oscillospiraceae bacterium]|nr:phosphatase [Oscillospiraceae bacterium]
MHYAVIDLGSNSIRLSVYERDGLNLQKTFSDKSMAGLAGYISNDELDMVGINKASSILRYFKSLALKFTQIENIHVFASASLRNVSNGEKAVEIIFQETGLSPVILSGDEEAALGYAGTSRFIDCSNGVMIDIGGASTELVLFKNGVPERLESLPIGCLNLYVKHVGEILPNLKERERIDETVKEQFAKVKWANQTKQPVLVGTGGTVRATLALSRVLFDISEEDYTVFPRQIDTIAKHLARNKDNIYLKVYRTVPDRLMTISTGLAILKRAIKVFDCETISVSNFGVREGYLIERILGTGDQYVISHRFED